jgi:hypothetical protein
MPEEPPRRQGNNNRFEHGYPGALAADVRPYLLIAVGLPALTIQQNRRRTVKPPSLDGQQALGTAVRSSAV